MNLNHRCISAPFKRQGSFSFFSLLSYFHLIFSEGTVTKGGTLFVAIYHLSVKVLGRKTSGRSSVAAAAYRSGTKLVNERDGMTHDYSRRKDIDHREVMVPKDAPEWMQDRQQLWNAIEHLEKRKDAQTAREMDIALPRELTLEQQKKLLRGFVKEEFVDKGLVADIAIHDARGNNPHAHVLLTTRIVDKHAESGFASKSKDSASRDFNKKEALEGWRKAWADHANRALADSGNGERIDHRSYDERGINKTPQVHLGVEAKSMKRKGQRTRQEARQKERDSDNAVRGIFAKAVKQERYKESDAREIQKAHKRRRERFRPGYARKRDEFERYLSQEQREKLLGREGR
jgi:hypothetical protein